MNDEQKEWSKQYTSNIGAKEFLRLGCAIMLWVFIGVGVSLIFELLGYSVHNIVFGTFFIILFVLPFVAYSRKPAYSLLRKILGNENLPREPYPRSNMKITRPPRPWWSYLPGIWFLLLD